jgi:hypothetical protein
MTSLMYPHDVFCDHHVEQDITNHLSSIINHFNKNKINQNQLFLHLLYLIPFLDFE